MSMDLARFLQLHPRLYHMAEANAWPSIQRHGLLSTEALLDLFEIQNPLREQLLTAHRPDSVEIAHPVHGVATVRDQKPLRENVLRRCLQDGLTPTDWYQILNSKTFFWTTESRLLGLLSARAYRRRAHCVITIDSASLLEAHINNITLSPYNSGCTLYNAPNRGNDTFLPFNLFDYDMWRMRNRQPDKVVVELAVSYSVPQIVNHVCSAKIMQRGDTIEVLFEK